MISIIKATLQELITIQDIAYRVWYSTYESILSKQQIEYMLKAMYSEESLTQQIEIENHIFFLAQENNQTLGFMSIELNYQNSKSAKLHKIYVLAQTQGKGGGRLLMDKAEEIARDHQTKIIRLNVNRNNPALKFYQKLGYQIITSEDIDIGQGYLMEDYVLEKNLY